MLAFWLTPTTEPQELKRLHHQLVWAEVIEQLAYLWKVDPDRLRDRIRTSHAGIPRGRVGNTYSGHWVIGHGEIPIVPREEERLKRIFHLQQEQVRDLQHDHWDRQSKEVEQVEHALRELRE
jgi:hypothetical protein